MKTQTHFVLRATIWSGALLLMLFSAGAVYAGRVVVEVTDCNGNAVGGATVELWRVDPGPPRAETLVDEKTTPPNGTVEFAPVSNGTYLVRVGCPNGDYLPTDDKNHDFTVTGNRSVHQRFICCPGSGSGKRKASTTTGGGLHTSTFVTPQGNVIVNLPDDMRAGDKISGTVKAEPKGQTEQERATNMAVLTGCVIEIEPPKKPDGTSNPKVTAQVTAALSPFTFTLPPSSPPTPPLRSVSSGSTGSLGITLTNTTGSFTVHGTTTVPIEIVSLSLQSVAPIQVQFPTLAQQGKPVEITSGNRSLDGNSATTNCTVAGQPVVVLAESPGKVVIENLTNATGPVEIVLKEGNQETKGTYRNVKVDLTAPKTSLLKGESTELHVEVTGLQGIKQPVPLTLDSTDSTGVITKQGGPYELLVIQPSQVGADGRYTTTRGITGIQAGGWNATATVVTHRFDFCLQDDSNPRTVVLVNSFTGNYLFPLPGGTSLSGTGTVTMKAGCTITLTDSRPDRKVQSTIDPCTQTGSASLQVVSPKVKFTITDRNTTNNTCAVP